MIRKGDVEMCNLHCNVFYYYLTSTSSLTKSTFACRDETADGAVRQLWHFLLVLNVDEKSQYNYQVSSPIII